MGNYELVVITIILEAIYNVSKSMIKILKIINNDNQKMILIKK